MNDKLYRKKVMGCWLGKAAGGTLGQPYEGCDGPLNLTYYNPVPTECGIFGPWFAQDEKMFVPAMPVKTRMIRFPETFGSINADEKKIKWVIGIGDNDSKQWLNNIML